MHVNAYREGRRPGRMLFAAYHFPPSAAVGGQRIANFARRLASLGWQIDVVTITDADVEHVDPGRMRGLEAVSIQKVPVRPTLLRRWSAAARRRRGSSGGAASMPASSAGASRPDGENLRRRLRRYLLSFLALPDFERGWVVPAIRASVRLVQQRDIDWIVTSCPPYSVHLVGLAVKRITGCRWLADFRDPWMTTGSKRLYPTSALSMRIESWLERKVMEQADLVTFNVERLRNAYRARYAHVPADKFVFIPNGIARQGQPLPPSERYPAFTLSYTGSLYVGRSADPIFQAVSRLLADGRVQPTAIRVKLVGQCRQMNGVPTSEIIRQYGLESVVEVVDPVPHAQALDIIRRSHLALLFAPNLPYQIPAKVYDYFGAGTRILAIADEGGTADLIRETGAGATFASEDVEGIASFIHQEVVSGGVAGLDRDAALARFDVERITDDLLAHLQRLTDGTVATLAR